jgi:hypothetical protein
MASQLPPVPPITPEGFTAQVWGRWLNQLRSYVNFSITRLNFDATPGIGGVAVTAPDGSLTIALSTTINGLIKGELGTFLQALPGTDYIAAITASGPLSTTTTAGVTALAMPSATASHDGYLRASDFLTFSNGVAASTTATGYGILSIDSIPIGQTIPAAVKTTLLTVTAGIAVPGYSFLTPTTGFNSTVAAGVSHTILAPAATLATGTVKLPAAPVDGFLWSLGTSQAITAFTLSPNTGQSVVAAPTTLTLGQGLRYLYRVANTTWYRLQ